MPARGLCYSWIHQLLGMQNLGARMGFCFSLCSWLTVSYWVLLQMKLRQFLIICVSWRCGVFHVKRIALLIIKPRVSWCNRAHRESGTEPRRASDKIDWRAYRPLSLKCPTLKHPQQITVRWGYSAFKAWAALLTSSCVQQSYLSPDRTPRMLDWGRIGFGLQRWTQPCGHVAWCPQLKDGQGTKRKRWVCVYEVP